MLLVAHTTSATCLSFSRSTRTPFPTVVGFLGTAYPKMSYFVVFTLDALVE